MFVLNKYSYVGLYLVFTFFILSVTNTSVKPKDGCNITSSATKSRGKKQVESDECVQNSVTEDKKKKKVSKTKKTKKQEEEEDRFSIPVFRKSIDVGRLDLRIGKILNASRHPDDDTLYVETIDVGEERPRQVVSELVKFVPLEELTGRMVVLLCNLKPSELRGIKSEGMVMCASSKDKVEILKPPQGSVPGDLIKVNGYTRSPDKVLKMFERIAKNLNTNHLRVACYKQLPWTVAGKGIVRTPSLKNAKIK